MPEPVTCLRCGGQLQPGFFYVRNNDNPIFFNYVVWVQGDIEKITQYMGTRANAPQHGLVPYRCEGCGLVELHSGPTEKWRH